MTHWTQQDREHLLTLITSFTCRFRAHIEQPYNKSDSDYRVAATCRNEFTC